MERYTLKNMNAIDLMDEMISNGKLVDLIVTDPPYKITSRGNSGSTGGMLNTDASRDGKIFEHNDIVPSDYAERCFKLLKDGTHAYIMTNAINLQGILNEFTSVGFKFIKPLIWAKPNKIMGRWYMTQFETILMFRKGKARPINNAGTSDIIYTPDFKKIKTTVNGKKKNLHDTEKPVELIQTLVLNSTNEGDVVFDPFTGIGSGGVASIFNNRYFIGSELDKNYYEIAKERFDNNGEVKSESEQLSLF